MVSSKSSSFLDELKVSDALPVSHTGWCPCEPDLLGRYWAAEAVYKSGAWSTTPTASPPPSFDSYKTELVNIKVDMVDIFRASGGTTTSWTSEALGKGGGGLSIRTTASPPPEVTFSYLLPSGMPL